MSVKDFIVLSKAFVISPGFENSSKKLQFIVTNCSPNLFNPDSEIGHTCLVIFCLVSTAKQLGAMKTPLWSLSTPLPSMSGLIGGIIHGVL